jgi:multiple sugar transport system permease protein
MSTQPLAATGPPLAVKEPRRPSLPGQLRAAEVKWGLAFIAPYAAVFLAFVVHPYAYALGMASDPALYADLFDDRLFLPTLVNTLLFVGVGVNLKMFLALLLSGFFLQPRRWIKVLLAIYVLPWALAAAQTCLSFHWMLIGEQGLVDGLLFELFGIEGPVWFNDRWLGLGCDIAAYIWKWMPFWTLIFLAARLTIPRAIYDAAEVDGATGMCRFVHVTFPLLANLYLICTLLSVLWTLGDFTTVYLVSNGGPAGLTNVLATLGYHYAFNFGRPALGVAAVITALPVLIPIAVILMRRFHTSGVQL